MEKFVVKVCSGVVTNARKGTSREGYWINVRDIPKAVAGDLWCLKDKARPSLAWDLHTREWRDMKNAQQTNYTIANAVLVHDDDGRKMIALLDF